MMNKQKNLKALLITKDYKCVEWSLSADLNNTASISITYIAESLSVGHWMTAKCHYFIIIVSTPNKHQGTIFIKLMEDDFH